MSGTLNSEKRKMLVASYSKPVAFKLLCVAVGFINSILINRCLGVALRGEYTIITNWASLIQLFLNLGIGTAYPAFKRKDPQNSKCIFSTITFVMAIAYALISVVLLPIVSAQNRYILLLTVITTIENLLIYIAIVEDVTKRNVINLMTSIIHAVVLVVVLLFYNRNLNAIMIAIFLDHILLCCSFVWLYHIHELNFGHLKIETIISILKIAIPAMLMNMLMYLNYHADVLFLGHLVDDPVEVGLYGTAVTLGNMLWISPDAFKDVLFNRAAKKDNPQEILLAIVCNCLLCIVIIAGFILLGKPFLYIMYGQEYVASYPLVLLLFVGTLPMILYKLIHPIYIANGNTKIVVILLSVAVIINIIGNILLIPEQKGVGAAISSVVSYSICGIAFYWKFKRDYGVSLKSSLSKLKK